MLRIWASAKSKRRTNQQSSRRSSRKCTVTSSLENTTTCKCAASRASNKVPCITGLLTSIQSSLRKILESVSSTNWCKDSMRGLRKIVGRCVSDRMVSCTTSMKLAQTICTRIECRPFLRAGQSMDAPLLALLTLATRRTESPTANIVWTSSITYTRSSSNSTGIIICPATRALISDLVDRVHEMETWADQAISKIHRIRLGATRAAWASPSEAWLATRVFRRPRAKTHPRRGWPRVTRAPTSPIQNPAKTASLRLNQIRDTSTTKIIDKEAIRWWNLDNNSCHQGCEKASA